MGKRAKTLTDLEWERVFRVRCKSKQGQQLTDEEQTLVHDAYLSDKKRYASMAPAVFNATAPVGSSREWEK